MFFLNLFLCVEMWTWTKRCLALSRAGRFVTGDERMISMSFGRFILMMFSCKDTSVEVCMFRAHT